MKRTCEVCGVPLDAHRCTNGRCYSCHVKHCTPGGDTSPGHGRGTVATTTMARSESHVSRAVDDLDDLICNTIAEHAHGLLDGLTEKQARDVARRVANSVEEEILGDWEYVKDQGGAK